jgi:hypothetical protein
MECNLHVNLEILAFEPVYIYIRLNGKLSLWKNTYTPKTV